MILDFVPQLRCRFSTQPIHGPDGRCYELAPFRGARMEFRWILGLWWQFRNSGLSFFYSDDQAEKTR